VQQVSPFSDISLHRTRTPILIESMCPFIKGLVKVEIFPCNEDDHDNQEKNHISQHMDRGKAQIKKVSLSRVKE